MAEIILLSLLGVYLLTGALKNTLAIMKVFVESARAAAAENRGSQAERSGHD